MLIHEAIWKANVDSKAIRRMIWREQGLVIIPTNSDALKMYVVSLEGKKGSRYWNPSAEDLTADDWEVF